MPDEKPPESLACHRFYVPLAYPEPVMDGLGKPKRNLSGQIEMQVKPQVANSQCLGAKCMLWNSDRLECYDKTQAQAIRRIADNYVVPHGTQ